MKMALTGKQKGALLLLSLDVATATQLLRGLDPEVVQELAVELTYLDAAGHRGSEQSTEVARQFCDCLQANKVSHINSFLNEMLKSIAGAAGTGEIKRPAQDVPRKRGGFIPIDSVDAGTIAAVLEHEHPRVVALALSELPSKKSAEVLGFLGEGIRVSAINRMANSEAATPEAKAQIVETVCKHISRAIR
jgi:flagellar motor switch protein FliG